MLTCSAAQAASYAQRALEAKSAEELEEAALRSARAQSQAEEAEARAATAAAMATAHQEVSASQAAAAEQACLLLMALLGPDKRHQVIAHRTATWQTQTNAVGAVAREDTHAPFLLPLHGKLRHTGC